ncbi:unnamed protein product, partial [Mesorhabditis belari]|uniref:Uncharacterized protein n=1 Tax=Mesorhabditis belari TaxID=2138241 RepID=A0AAF3FAI1_9BILA
MYGDCYKISVNGDEVYPENVKNFRDSSDQLNGNECGVDDLIEEYLNRNDVFQALRVDLMKNNNQPFKICRNVSEYQADYSFKTNLPYILSHFIYRQNDMKILILNGDVDLVYNHIGVERFLNGINGVKNNLDFSTIKGAGHWIGLDRPMQSLQIMYNFMNDQNYRYLQD